MDVSGKDRRIFAHSIVYLVKWSDSLSGLAGADSLDSNCEYRSPQIHERTSSLRYLGKILTFLRLEVSIYTLFTLQPSFKPFQSVSRGDSEKQGAKQDVCPNYVQEFGLWNFEGYSVDVTV